MKKKLFTCTIQWYKMTIKKKLTKRSASKYFFCCCSLAVYGITIRWWKFNTLNEFLLLWLMYEDSNLSHSMDFGPIEFLWCTLSVNLISSLQYFSAYSRSLYNAIFLAWKCRPLNRTDYTIQLSIRISYEKFSLSLSFLHLFFFIPILFSMELTVTFGRQ